MRTPEGAKLRDFDPATHPITSAARRGQQDGLAGAEANPPHQVEMLAREAYLRAYWLARDAGEQAVGA